MGRRVRRVVRRVTRGARRAIREVTRGVDSITGDILDLDGSKQKEQIEAMRRAEEQAQREAEAKRRAEEQYQQDVANAKDKFVSGDGLSIDTSGVGLEDSVDFTKKISKSDDEDDLKKILRRY